MNQFGETLTNMLGTYKTTEVTPMGAQRSGTTNSYNKCLEQLAPKFSAAIIAKAQTIIDKYDRASFDDKTYIEDVVKYNPDTGTPYIAGRLVLKVKGSYEFKWFAHCKTIEICTDIEPLTT